MTAIDDPFAALPDDLFQPGPADFFIIEGATVETITRHPIFGTMYHCRGWICLTPWGFNRKSTVTAYRGENCTDPSPGSAGIVKLRRNGTDVREVSIGHDVDEVLFDLVLDEELPVEVGDTLTFERR